MSLADRLKAAGVAKSAFGRRPVRYNPGSGVKVSGTTDMRRIVSLPIAAPLTEQQLQAASDEFVKARARVEGFSLWEPQARVVLAYREFGGCFAPITVGGGKTISSLLCAQIGYLERDHRRIALMVPPRLVPKTMHDLRAARRKVTFDVPVTNMYGLGKRERMAIAKSPRKGVFIYPYSFLQVQDGYELLRAMGFTLYIMDEAHKLKNLGAPSTRRWVHCVDELVADGQRVEMVPLSGTLSTKGIRDYYHLVTRALHERSPVPLLHSEANEWDDAIDVNAETDPRAGSLSMLITWARQNFPDASLPQSRSGFRTAYKLRFENTEGVVCAGDANVGASLAIDFLETEIPLGHPGAKELLEHTALMQKALITPTGEELPHALLAWKWLYELSSGFYNKRVWPEPEALAHGQRISIEEARERLRKAKIYEDKQKVYHKRLKVWFDEFGEPGLDTPLTVGNHMARHGSLKVGKELFRLWTEMKDSDFPDRPEKLRVPVRVCDFKARAAVEWAKSRKSGCILWVHNHAMRHWLVDLLREETARKVIDGAAGDQEVERELLDPSNAKAIMVLQMGSYKEGHNLQYMHDMLFVQVPRQADVAEQCIGRVHRPGLEADEFTAHFLLSTETDEMAFAAACNDALYIDETLTSQKLMYGDYLSAPPYFDFDVLRAQVPDVKRLSPAQQAKLREKFLDKD